MIKHIYTETTDINFGKLEERLRQINDPNIATYIEFKKQEELLANGSTLIVATGGSKAAGYYLKMYLEENNITCEVLEPRDYFYKPNTHSFKNLIAISSSGKSNGILEILRNHPGNNFLITSDYKMQDADFLEDSKKPLFTPIYWSNPLYTDREKSFISLVPTLAPMLMFLELSLLKEKKTNKLTSADLKKINSKLKELKDKSEERISNLHFNFKEANLIQIMSGYDTICSASILESNIVETGMSSVVIHDKGSFCHGRSNLLFQNPESPLIYLSHTKKELDKELLELLIKEYPNIFLFHTINDNLSPLEKEYYLALQMYYLSKKIAEDKGVDLTCPEYNTNIVKKIYKYRGEM